MKRLLCFTVMVLLLFAVATIGFGSINEYELPIAGVLAAPAAELFAPEVSRVHTAHVFYTLESANTIITISQKVPCLELSACYNYTNDQPIQASALVPNLNGGVANRLIFPLMG